MDKRKKQLKENFSTACGRLRRNIMFKLVNAAGYKCFRCGKKMTLETFSVDHKIPWLDSDNPRETFFNLKNIAYSHRSCNSSVARRTNKKYPNIKARQKAEWTRYAKRHPYDAKKRRERYLKTGS